jgi:hypothetical protein
MENAGASGVSGWVEGGYLPRGRLGGGEGQTSLRDGRVVYGDRGRGYRHLMPSSENGRQRSAGPPVVMGRCCSKWWL